MFTVWCIVLYCHWYVLMCLWQHYDSRLLSLHSSEAATDVPWIFVDIYSSNIDQNRSTVAISRSADTHSQICSLFCALGQWRYSWLAWPSPGPLGTSTRGLDQFTRCMEYCGRWGGSRDWSGLSNNQPAGKRKNNNSQTYVAQQLWRPGSLSLSCSWEPIWLISRAVKSLWTAGRQTKQLNESAIMFLIRWRQGWWL